MHREQLVSWVGRDLLEREVGQVVPVVRAQPALQGQLHHEDSPVNPEIPVLREVWALVERMGYQAARDLLASPDSLEVTDRREAPARLVNRDFPAPRELRDSTEELE